MADYYDKRDAKMVLYRELKDFGWAIKGFKEDQSDSQSDYYDPASWEGVAHFGAFTLCVDVSSWYSKNLGLLDTPKGCAWHIEKEGALVLKGSGVFIFSSLRHATNYDGDRDNGGTFWNGKEIRPLRELFSKLDILMKKWNDIASNTNTKEAIKAQKDEAEAIRRQDIEKAEKEAYKIYLAEKKMVLDNYSTVFANLPVLKVGDRVYAQTMRKCSDIHEVLDECRYAETTTSKVIEIVELEHEAFTHFIAHLMDNYDFLSEKGGTYCDDPRLDGMSFMDIMNSTSLKEIYHQTSYSANIMVKEKDTNYYVLCNPHGYSYARYTSIPRSVKKL